MVPRYLTRRRRCDITIRQFQFRTSLRAQSPWAISRRPCVLSQCSRSMSTSCPYQTQATNHFDKGDTKIIDTIALKSPLKIIFLGAPGSGKGTYSGIISKSLGHLPIYSTGDLLRDEIQHKTEITWKAINYQIILKFL